MHRTIRWLALGAAVCLLAACSHQDKNAPLAFVPADTPYVVANLKPLSDEALAALEPASASTTLWAARVAQVQRAADQLQTNEPHLANLLRAVGDSARGRSYAQMQDETGLDRHGVYVLYGQGLSPVTRGPLIDPAKFKAYIAKLEKAYGTPFATATLDRRDYQHVELGKSGLQLLVATHDKQFVAALLPAAASTTQLRLVLGLDRPAQSLQASGRLSELAKAEGYGPYLVGYLDTTRLPALLAGARDPLLQAIIRTAGAKGNPVNVTRDLPAACEPELARIAARVPMISAGYTKLDSKEKAAQVDVHLAPDIVQAFKNVGTEVPGLGEPSDAPLDFGMALPVPAFRKFWLAQAEAVAAKPFTCPALTELNQMFAKMQAALPKTAMPPFGDLRGFRLVLDQIDLAGLSTGMGHLPTLQARLLIASHNAEGLLGMAKAMVPGFTGLNVARNSTPVALPPDLTSKAGQPAWIAMSDKALALGIGKGEQDRLPTMLGAAAAHAGTVMHVHMTGAFYVHWLQTIDREMARFQGMDKQDAEAATAKANFHARMAAAIATAKHIKDVNVDVTLTDQGIRMSGAQQRMQ